MQNANSAILKSPPSPRCMGMTHSYALSRRRRRPSPCSAPPSSAASPSLTPLKSTAPSTTKSSSAKGSLRLKATSSSPPNSASTSTLMEHTVQGPDSSPERIRQVCDASLSAFASTSSIFLPASSRSKVPIEDTAGAVKDLIAAGKVKHFGMSEAGAATIRRATRPAGHRAPKRYSLWYRKPEKKSFQPSRSSASASFLQPLGKGFLTGKIDETSTFAKSDLRNSIHASRQKPARPTSLWSIYSPPSASPKTHPPHRSPSPAPRAKAVDCSHPRHNQDSSSRREHRSRLHRAHC